ncbi:MAG: hypothetical protein KGM60_00605 [Comamonadaceae bacterium]|nr:hypothetical protein [Comamonadaceae bacterium]
MKCPKCSYERKSTDHAPDYECPSCGIIYDKYRPAGTSTTTLSSARKTKSLEKDGDLDGNRGRKFNFPPWAIPIFIGLIVGYFAGREHIKYELRQTFQAAAEGITKGFSTALGSAPPEQKKVSPPVAKPKTPPQLSATLEKKGFQEANYKVGLDDAITFTITFKNLTGKSIRAFDGNIIFTDLLDNVILSANLAINDPVEANSSLEWMGQINYNQFIDKHKRLRNEDFQNIKIQFNTKKILFTDGVINEF